MPALSNTDRDIIAWAYQFYAACTRDQMIEAFTADNPEPDTVAYFAAEPDRLNAALLGRAQARIRYLADLAETLADHLDKRQAGDDGPGLPWAVWRVDENAGRAREVGQMPREMAKIVAAQLNEDTRPPGVHFDALPLGGSPFDATGSDTGKAGS